MKLFVVTIFGFLLIAPAWAGESYDVEVVKQPEQKWRFQRLTAYQSGEGISIHGRLTATQRFNLPSGHVDIAAYSPGGQLIEKTTTTYKPSILTYRSKRKGGVRFSADLAKKLPPDSIVKVAFHRDEPRPELSPAHYDTIAR